MADAINGALGVAGSGQTVGAVVVAIVADGQALALLAQAIARLAVGERGSVWLRIERVEQLAPQPIAVLGTPVNNASLHPAATSLSTSRLQSFEIVEK